MGRRILGPDGQAARGPIKGVAAKHYRRADGTYAGAFDDPAEATRASGVEEVAQAPNHALQVWQAGVGWVESPALRRAQALEYLQETDARMPRALEDVINGLAAGGVAAEDELLPAELIDLKRQREQRRGELG